MPWLDVSTGVEVPIPDSPDESPGFVLGADALSEVDRAAPGWAALGSTDVAPAPVPKNDVPVPVESAPVGPVHCGGVVVAVVFSRLCGMGPGTEVWCLA